MARQGDKKTNGQSRRAFLKNTGVAMAAGAVGLGAGKGRTAEQPLVSIDEKRLQQLARDAKAARQFAASTRQLAKSMASDPVFAGKLLENMDSVQLINIFNKHRSTLEGIVGKVDGRTTEGRYTKMLTVSELFVGVTSVDGVQLVEGSEELCTLGDRAVQGSCAGCDAMGASFLGCCIIHFWGWTSTGSCSPCNG